MNLFRLHDSPTQAAIFNQDLHIRKIILESAGLLFNAYSESILKSAPPTQIGNSRKHSWYNHPLSLWTRENINNFKWTFIHFVALCEEYEYRFNKKHFCHSLIDWFNKNKPELSDKPETIQPQCFGDLINKCYVKGNPVEGYRKYYNAAKLSFDFNGRKVKAKWTKREIPYWIDRKRLDN